MSSVEERSIRLGARRLPVVLPNRRDARLHTAAVIISLHTIGITALGFAVSVPQIATAMLTAGIIDVLFTLQSTGKLVWPASGLLTGSGVGLILRLGGMTAGQYWSWDGWYWFSLVAAVSILTKFVVRVRGQHLFNPSNLGLVLAFLVLGSEVVEPLDFWWSPLGPWMIVVYGLIVVGGVLITRRLHLLEMALTFWSVLAVGLGVLAVSGHCMTTSWSPTPVCDGRFWTVLVTSPEILIFLFFMITDPRTIPAGRSARVVFAGSLAALVTILIAPQSVEFGAKVALLGGLVLWSPLRFLFDRVVPDIGPDQSMRATWLRSASAGLTEGRAFARGVVLGAGVALVAVGIVAAGVPARQPTAMASPVVGGGVVAIDADTLPNVEIDPTVSSVNIPIDETVARSLAVMLAENLATEAEAIRTADGGLLGAVDAGGRLDEMQARLDEVIATGDRVAQQYRFTSLVLRPFDGGGQSGAALAFDGEGALADIAYDAGGGEVSRSEHPFSSVFVLRQVAGDRWLLVALEPGT